MPEQEKNKIRVLIVEDSPTMLFALEKTLNADPEIYVIGKARDGKEAVKKTLRFKPDLITMDVNLPVQNGLETTREIMAVCPTPIVIVSGPAFVTQNDKVFHAMSCGAVDVINKDELVSVRYPEKTSRLIEKIKFLSKVRTIRHPIGNLKKPKARKTKPPPVPSSNEKRIVAIVGSTGGPKALAEILGGFPESFPHPVVVVIHIATGFVGGLVEWLRRVCVVKAKTAEPGERLLPGMVYVAPSNFHMKVTENKTVELCDDPPVKGLKPCGDILLESVAEVYGENSIGVILTGMGKDGAAGIKEIHKRGGKTIAQDEKTSVIFGMPRVAIESGAIDSVLPLGKISKGIFDLLEGM